MSKLLLLMLGSVIWYETSIYTYTVPSINGGNISLSQYQGKKIFLVDIATASSRANQLHQLEQLYQMHKDSMVVIGFPSNSFGNEPGSNESTEDILRNTYHVTFPLTAKIIVTGDSAHAIYKWLASKDENGVTKSRIRGDFQKYLLDRHGKLVGIFDTATAPMSNRILEGIRSN